MHSALSDLWRIFLVLRPFAGDQFVKTVERALQDSLGSCGLQIRHAAGIVVGMTVSNADSLNRLTSTIIDAAIRVHRTIGPGLVESAYFACLRYELVSAGLQIEAQKAITLRYDAVVIDCAYRVDLLVADAVIVETCREQVSRRRSAP